MNTEKPFVTHSIKFPEGKLSKIDELYFDFKDWWKYNVWYNLPFFIRIPFVRVHDLYRKYIKSIFCPLNIWVTKVVPRGEWTDKVEVIPNLMFAAVIDFVEREECFEAVYWEPEIEAKIQEIYDYAKVIRPDLQKKMDDSYPPLRKWDAIFIKKCEDREGLFEFVDDGIPYEVKYAGVRKYENMIWKMDTQYAKMVIDIRDYLWT
jgi:hypothetical protein